MKNQNYRQLFQLFFTPVLVIFFGLILIVRPDSVSGLVGNILGYALVAAGIFCGISAVMDKNQLARKVVSSLVLVLVGGWILNNPLRLAAWIGRLIGILIAARGIQDIQAAKAMGQNLGFSLVTAAVGVLLVVIPMTASRLVMLICGIVVLLLGITMLLDRLKRRRYLDDSNDKNIIDAL